VVRGTAKVTLNGAEFLVNAGEAVDIAVGVAHRVENPLQTRSSSSKRRLVTISVKTTSNELRTTLDE